MSDLYDVQAKIAGTMGNDEGGEAVVLNLFSHVVTYDKTAADGAASTATSNTKIWCNPYTTPMKILRATLNPAGTLTASDTDYATVSLLTDDGAAGTPAAATTILTKLSASGGSGNWATSVSQVFGNQTAAALTVPAGGCIWFAIAKAGSGVTVPISKIQIVLAKL